ncbi:MAG: sigma-70 family RNA polymerase sigma factor [Candidatus Pedobacter colombiensis]|uniref:Sigma-70 family RNA polymerase sigma factor n=1 Tax=Candidatus Pedobacter colombiensis TaxID=3121371 RepID=A0AAJ5W9N2_9SPHI|nr:sigma-70 family RNA polymerase sigma factor [Pedobacter sp.]WEK21338.1 MAG: sigma-70 family RNA polymerase sigma factor [Pedobacter sp.]
MDTQAIIAADSSLLQQVKQGDHTAFNQLYKLFAKDVFSRIKYLVHDQQIAEELHQDIFLKIWEKRASLNCDVPIRSIVMRNTKSIAIDYYRKAARDQKLKEHLIHTATELYDHLEELIDFKETNAALQSAITKLPPQRLKIFTMCKLEGHSYEQAANEYGVSLSTIKDHMAKAMKSIKEDMVALHPEMLLLLVASTVLL